MMAPDPTPRFIRQPAAWPPISFVLADAAGEMIVPLPPTVGFDGLLGEPDPYEWDRAPGSAVWYPLGDGQPKERPQLKLRGEWTYRSRSEALAHTAALAAALRSGQVSQIQWCGRHLANVWPQRPGAYQYTCGTRYVDITHQLVCNLTAPLDIASLDELQAAPPLDYRTITVTLGSSVGGLGGPWYRDANGNIIIQNLEKAADKT